MVIVFNLFNVMQIEISAELISLHYNEYIALLLELEINFKKSQFRL